MKTGIRMWNGLRRVSKKRQKALPEYNALMTKLRALCNNRSEISGDKPNWQSNYLVDPHHIQGRVGELLIDPFNIILLTRPEHDDQDSNTYDDKKALLKLIEPVRIKQGFAKK